MPEDGGEVGEVSPVVQLFSDDGVTGDLHEIHTRRGEDVTGGEEVVARGGGGGRSHTPSCRCPAVAQGSFGSSCHQ